MPSHPRASDVAHEAKRHYIPYINQYIYDNRKDKPNLTTGSYLVVDSSQLDLSPLPRLDSPAPRVAVIEGDAVDVALAWQETEHCSNGRCPVVSAANQGKPGGDWETVAMGPEECFARRSNLASALRTPYGEFAPRDAFYPLPTTGGIYSPCVVVFRNGPDDYKVWETFKDLPAISVAPVRRPKLDRAGTGYAFAEERAMMRERMQTILRLAAANGHRDLCVGAFGVGPACRNPPRQVAEIWRELLFEDDEFKGLFKNVIFAFDTRRERGASASGGGSGSSSGARRGDKAAAAAAAAAAAGGAADGGAAEMEVFNEVFDPFSKYR